MVSLHSNKPPNKTETFIKTKQASTGHKAEVSDMSELIRFIHGQYSIIQEQQKLYLWLWKTHWKSVIDRDPELRPQPAYLTPDQSLFPSTPLPLWGKLFFKLFI